MEMDIHYIAKLLWTPDRHTCMRFFPIFEVRQLSRMSLNALTLKMDLFYKSLELY